MKLSKGRYSTFTTNCKQNLRKNRQRTRTKKTTMAMMKMTSMEKKTKRIQTTLFWVMRWPKLVFLIF
jgi:hypothetical protein